MAREIEKTWPKGIKMLRVDAIRQPDNTIRIIELNPCWIDNIAALQAFYEVYQLPCPGEKEPTAVLAEEIKKALPEKSNRNLALVYCLQADGCRKDEIFGLADYLQATGLFDQIVIAPLKKVIQTKDGAILVKSTEVSAIYLNGSFAMASEFITEESAVQKLRSAQERGLFTLSPAQFIELDQKVSLVWLSKQKPNLFLQTEKSPQRIQLPLIAKPTRSESVAGVKVITNLAETESLGAKCVFQPMLTATKSEIICFDSKIKRLTKPPFVYEKINLWIIEEKIVGALATYSENPLISDSGYNLPILLEAQ